MQFLVLVTIVDNHCQSTFGAQVLLLKKTPQNQKYFKEYGCVWTSVLYIKCSCFNNNEQRGLPIFLPNTGDYAQALVRYSLHLECTGIYLIVYF